MPSGSKLKDLIKDLQDRQSNITRALNDMLGSAAALADYRSGGARHPPPGHAIRNQDGLVEPGTAKDLPPWAIHELATNPHVARRLRPDEITHIESWPKQQMEDVRKAIVGVIDNPGAPPLNFSWVLHDGNNEETDVSDLPNIVFRSPQKRLTSSGWAPPWLSAKFNVPP